MMDERPNPEPLEPLEPRPEPRAFKIEDLFPDLRLGRVRIPSLQRGIRWKWKDATKFFESLLGTLSRDRHDGCEFRLLESYKQNYPRLVLGQTFLDDLNQVHRTRSKVPPWFSNLLPKDLYATRWQNAMAWAVPRILLLRHLGEDLPGTVRIIADPSTGEAEEPDESDDALGAGEWPRHKNPEFQAPADG